MANKPQPERELPQIVQKLKAWRASNRLSQRQTEVVLFERYNFVVAADTISKWENGHRTPRSRAAKALQAIMERHPQITNPPKFGRWVRRKK